MPDETEKRYRVVNQLGQPVELHLADGVRIVDPYHHVELGAKELASPQVDHLLRERHLVAQEIEPPPPPPAPASKRPAREPARKTSAAKMTGRRSEMRGASREPERSEQLSESHRHDDAPSEDGEPI